MGLNRVAVSGLVASLCAAGVLGLTPARFSSAAQPERQGGDVAAEQTDEIDQSLVEMESAALRARDKLDARLNGRFFDLWRDESGQWNASVAGQSREDARVVEEVFDEQGLGHVVVHSAMQSAPAALGRYQGIAQRLANSGVRSATVTIDDSTGTIVIDVPEAQSEKATEFVRRDPDRDYIRLVTQNSTDERKWEAADSRETYPPYKAGRRIIDVGKWGDVGYSSAGNCTAGFTVYINTSPYLKQGSTAGHCTATNTWIRTTWNGSSNVNTVGVTNFNSLVTGNCDCVRIGPSYQSQFGNLLYVNSTLTRSVTSRTRTDRMVKGTTQVCSSAWKTGVLCGIYRQYPITLYYEDTNQYVNFAAKWDGNIQGGDSGGPIYIPVSTGSASAVGMTIAHFRVNGVSTDGAFHPMGIYEKYSGTWLFCTQPGTRCTDR